MKHIAKMKNNSARVVVVYRTLPGDSSSALVVGTQGLPDAYHDSLMSLVQEDAGQTANELADILAVRRFPDGTNMLEFLHMHRHLKKVPTNLVLMTPTTQVTIQLDELNKLIADQKGVSVDNLAINDGSETETITEPPSVIESSIQETVATPVPGGVVTYDSLISKADELMKQAAELKELAKSMKPIKAKKETKAV